MNFLVKNLKIKLGLLATCFLVPLQAQLNYDEPPELSNNISSPTFLGTLELGFNVIRGSNFVDNWDCTTSCTPNDSLGRDADSFSYEIPVGLRVVDISFSSSNYQSSGTGNVINEVRSSSDSNISLDFSSGVFQGLLQGSSQDPSIQNLHISVSSADTPGSVSYDWRVIIETEEVFNDNPIADPGPDQSVQRGELVTLDGTQSYDDITATADLEYLWELTLRPAGSNAVLSDPTSATPSFIADEVGEYSAALIVTDEEGLRSLGISVKISSENLAPISDAGFDQLVIIDNSVVVLDGSGSSDPENDPLTYNWEIISKPAGSLATLDDNTSVSPGFIPDLEGDYEIQLTVSDLLGPGDPDTTIVRASDPTSLAQSKLLEASNLVKMLDKRADFRKKTDKKRLLRSIRAISKLVDRGYIDFAIKILKRVIKKNDGCALRGEADGRFARHLKKDQITTCADQEFVYDCLVQALQILEEIQQAGGGNHGHGSDDDDDDDYQNWHH